MHGRRAPYQLSYIALALPRILFEEKIQVSWVRLHLNWAQQIGRLDAECEFALSSGQKGAWAGLSARQAAQQGVLQPSEGSL